MSYAYKSYVTGSVTDSKLRTIHILFVHISTVAFPRLFIPNNKLTISIYCEHLEPSIGMNYLYLKTIYMYEFINR